MAGGLAKGGAAYRREQAEDRTRESRGRSCNQGRDQHVWQRSSAGYYIPAPGKGVLTPTFQLLDGPEPIIWDEIAATFGAWYGLQRISSRRS
jgi:hypothetical protein